MVWHQKVRMLLFNTVPFFHAAGIVAMFFIPGINSPFARLGLALAWLYLLPPLLARMLLLVRPIQQGKIAGKSPDFLTWWILLNLQVLFCRFPFLEEFLRLVPALYSFWLRLWGARIGRLTYWAPGVMILDRPFLRLGDHVVFAVGARLNPHVMVKDANAEPELILADIEIGDRVQIGGYSLLTAGTVVAADEIIGAFQISPPFTQWQNGHREKGAARKGTTP